MGTGERAHWRLSSKVFHENVNSSDDNLLMAVVLKAWCPAHLPNRLSASANGYIVAVSKTFILRRLTAKLSNF
jgi:hypothetical protein